LTYKQRAILKKHLRERAASAPDIEAVVVLSVVEEQLRGFVISTSNSHVVFLARNIKLSQPPVDDPKLFAHDVEHDVLRFDVSVHDAVGVSIVEGHQKLEHIIPAIDVLELFEHSAHR